MTAKHDYDVIIIGGGPAGLAAALYTGRDRLETLLLEQLAVGGQVNTTWDVENYPGFESITGPELVAKLESHARKFGAKFQTNEVLSVEKKDDVVSVKTTEGEISSKTLIIASGASYRTLGIPGESEFRGKGVSYCATCDGAFYRNMEVAVVGGGNTALDEGLFLTKFASKVTLIHRRNELRGDIILQERFLAHEKTEVIWDSVPVEILGDTGGVEKVRLKNKKTDELSELAVKGIFIFIGNTPNTKFLEATVELDQWNGVVVKDTVKTSVPGIFSAGDCSAGAPRQIAAAVGDGVRAALAAKAYLSHYE